MTTVTEFHHKSATYYLIQMEQEEKNKRNIKIMDVEDRIDRL